MNSMKTLSIALFSVLAAACSAKGGQPGSPNGPNQVIATDGDNGQSLTAKAGEEVVLSLTDHGDSGYQWSVVSGGGLGGGAASHVDGSGQPGDFGTDDFTFTTAGLAAGSYTINMVDQRSWDPTSAQPFTVTVKIGE
ncbi:MAG TPA: protease inhibitor I42 family protein [Polyangiaceae bacterium]